MIFGFECVAMAAFVALWRSRRHLVACLFAAALASPLNVEPLRAQTLEQDLERIGAAELASQARQQGDALRGAVVFFQPYLACSKCHAIGEATPSMLGPDLTKFEKEATDESLVESVLHPSRAIRKGYESVTALTSDGKSLTGLVVERTKDKIVIRELLHPDQPRTIAAADLESVEPNATSIMPAGQVNQLASRQQFLDLIRYLVEVRDGGVNRAKQLQPSPTLLNFALPEYEQHLDHRALIGDWSPAAMERGQAIYQRVCANCHGTKDAPGSLPTSLRFADGKFKNGSDPLSMYRTLTRGFGLMAAQSWMVPSQKYDVIHYIRETYLRPHNPEQFVPVDAAYLAALPKGDTRGPEPSRIEPWSAMDYGPSLTHTYEVPGPLPNFAYKGVAVRLDSGAGGVARGRHWFVFDADTLRAAAGWSHGASQGDNFIDWQGIQFNGAHQIHPHVVGKVVYSNSTGPGWSNPATGQFEDDLRVQGRDGRRYGPLPRAWAKYLGVYHHGQQIVFSYTVGATELLETPGLVARDAPQQPLFLRSFNIGPRREGLILQVAEHASSDARLAVIEGTDSSAVALQPAAASADTSAERKLAFDGTTHLEVARRNGLELAKDFTIAARLRTTVGGTIASMTVAGPKWSPNCRAFFVRDGRLCFDIGWVGVVTARSKVNDGRWHNVALTSQASDGRVRLYVDGRLDGEGKLAAKDQLPASVFRIGFASPDFPQPDSYFQGELAEVRVYGRRLTEGLGDFAAPVAKDDSLLARWITADAKAGRLADTTVHGHDLEIRRGSSPADTASDRLVAGFAPKGLPLEWTSEAGKLRLKIPAGKDPLRFTIWQTSDSPANKQGQIDKAASDVADVSIPEADRDLSALTAGGPARWPQKIETQAVIGADTGPLAVDVLTAPESNPWLAQTRFTGLDFFADSRMAVCTWDGDVWLVEGATSTSGAPATGKPAKLRWQRIASGLFQPLGLKIVDGKIHVTCRDQLVVLDDLNGDGETDFYRCLNNDHQVTEHFHEFAMGLQVDAAGNFYYAKSARHALPALVPHHGTLLRVSKDGATTEILANGFRAANGVCLNPDGSFVVTDQEGHWNPKNRLNWVTLDPSGKPKFYGNMLGYHDVTDPSDRMMEKPLCWITNTFDRSPAELLWVQSDRWGPLNGRLLNLSYGYGKVFVVPHEKVRGTMQGGMIELPLPTFPTGIMRGRFNPGDGQLYACGMFAWAGNATQPGGLYRIRATGQPMNLPLGVHAARERLEITFSDPLDPAAIDAKQVRIKTWSLKRTANYGSNHYDEKSLAVRGASLSKDGTVLRLELPDLAPTWCMEIDYTLRLASGKSVHGVIHNTIHELAE